MERERSGKGRAGAPARPLLILSAGDAAFLLAAIIANLAPLLPLDGLVTDLLFWSAVVLSIATGCGISAALGSRTPSRRSMVVAMGVSNGILVATTAAYFSVRVLLFGIAGYSFVFLSLPGFVGAWIAWKSMASP